MNRTLERTDIDYDGNVFKTVGWEMGLVQIVKKSRHSIYTFDRLQLICLRISDISRFLIILFCGIQLRPCNQSNLLESSPIKHRSNSVAIFLGGVSEKASNSAFLLVVPWQATRNNLDEALVSNLKSVQSRIPCNVGKGRVEFEKHMFCFTNNYSTHWQLI